LTSSNKSFTPSSFLFEYYPTLYSIAILSLSFTNFFADTRENVSEEFWPDLLPPFSSFQSLLPKNLLSAL